MKHREIDIKKGDLTYGQRIELGKILTNPETSDLEKTMQSFECLYKFRPKAALLWMYVREFERIVEGIAYWSQVESQMLHYEPTPEEQQAGADQYAKAVGELATLHTIAKAYSQDPDAVYNWKYSKVFGILLNDLESSKYQKRLQKVYNAKNK